MQKQDDEVGLLVFLLFHLGSNRFQRLLDVHVFEFRRNRNRFVIFCYGADEKYLSAALDRVEDRGREDRFLVCAEHVRADVGHSRVVAVFVKCVRAEIKLVVAKRAEPVSQDAHDFCCRFTAEIGRYCGPREVVAAGKLYNLAAGAALCLLFPHLFKCDAFEPVVALYDVTVLVVRVEEQDLCRLLFENLIAATGKQ